jgi:hypothetical protein
MRDLLDELADFVAQKIFSFSAEARPMTNADRRPCECGNSRTHAQLACCDASGSEQEQGFQAFKPKMADLTNGKHGDQHDLSPSKTPHGFDQQIF